VRGNFRCNPNVYTNVTAKNELRYNEGARMINAMTAYPAAVGAEEQRLLPYEEPVRTWAGHGSGALCNFCGVAIKSQDIEYEVEVVTAENSVRNLYFHFNCYRVWESQS
jgi:hypothetical protein